jgi:type II secretory pathway component PulF
MERTTISSRLSEADLAGMSDRVADVTAMGLPLGPGLSATADELPRGPLRSALRSISKALAAGASVDDALAAEGRRLPEHLRGLVLIGSRTGRMSAVLGRFVRFMSVGTDLRRRIWLSLAYPILAMGIAVAVFIFVCSTLVGTFATIFRDFGVPLPRLTLALLRVSQLFSVSWRAVGEGLISVLVLLLLTRFLLSEAMRRSLLSGIPVIGAVWRNMSLAEFCHLLALLLECEIPLPESLRLTGAGVRDASMDNACRAMGREVEGGVSLAEAISRRRVFPWGLHRVLHWAEGHQSLPETLQMAGEMFESRARTQATFAGTVFAVMAIISILSGVAVLAVGLFLPLITLISKLSG